LLIVSIGLAFNSLWSHGSVLGSNNDFSSASLLQATNQQRTDKQLNALQLNTQLSNAAQTKANDMAARNYWAHNTPDGQPPAAFVTSAGYSYQIIGENLAYGFSGAKEAIAGWMNSPEHRANVLDNRYQDVGFGIAQAPNFQGQGPATIVVAEYGAPTGAALGVSDAAPVALAAAPAHSISRVQLLTGQPVWITAAASALAGAAAAIFFVRHGLVLKRLVLEGEHFITNRPLLDIGLVFVGTLAIIFMQASGSIH
jgi:cysteine-rich secretory family protein